RRRWAGCCGSCGPTWTTSSRHSARSATRGRGRGRRAAPRARGGRSRRRGPRARLVPAGNAGRDRIPGKHGAAPTSYAVVTALLPDSPGQLARLFSDIGEAGINVEEFSLEHAPGRPVGLAEVSVLPAVRAALEEALVTRGWHVV